MQPSQPPAPSHPPREPGAPTRIGKRHDPDEDTAWLYPRKKAGAPNAPPKLPAKKPAD